MENIDCAEGDGSAYAGDMSTTKSGMTCQAWNVQTPNNHTFGGFGTHNHCRKPYPDSGTIGCFTTDGSNSWEECDVKNCSECNEGKQEFDKDYQ